VPHAAIVRLSAAVEGDVDEAVLRRVARHVGADINVVYGKRGKAHLKEHIVGYNQAAHFSPWVVLVDLDQDAECAPPLRRAWLPDPAPQMCFRIAVRELESWIMGDRDRLACFLRVPVARVPRDPESELDPKRTLLNLARVSRHLGIRSDMLPRARSARAVGPLYTSRLIEFVTDTEKGWRPDVAQSVCDSLARCIRCLRNMT